MKKIVISALAALVFTSCASIKSGQLSTDEQSSRPNEEVDLTTNVEVGELVSEPSCWPSYGPEIHHKEGWTHPAER